MSESSLPRIYDADFMDKAFLRHYVLLHDQSQSHLAAVEYALHSFLTLSSPDQTIDAMKKTFGLSCSLVVINGSGNDAFEDLWLSRTSQFASLARKVAAKCEDPEPVANLIPQPGPYGWLLSPEDLISFGNFVHDFTSQNLVPFMERNVQAWNSEVASRRKGVTGRLFSAGRKFFGGGSTPVAEASSHVATPQGDHMFVGQSHELLQRRLADYSFMLKDYRFAYTIYDGLRKELQGNENVLRYHAGCQEMIGICILLVDASGKSSVESYIDSAIESFRKTGEFLLETRTCMLFYELLKVKEMHRDAPIILNKMTGVSIILQFF